jgi:hypothetical protein
VKPEPVPQSKHEGPIQTRIVSECWDHFGMGVFDVRVHEQGISIKPIEEKEWKELSFADLMLIDLQEIIRDADFQLEHYNETQAEKIRVLEEKLTKLKSAIISEFRARKSRAKFSVEAKPDFAPEAHDPTK